MLRSLISRIVDHFKGVVRCQICGDRVHTHQLPSHIGDHLVTFHYETSRWELEMERTDALIYEACEPDYLGRQAEAQWNASACIFCDSHDCAGACGEMVAFENEMLDGHADVLDAVAHTELCMGCFKPYDNRVGCVPCEERDIATQEAMVDAVRVVAGMMVHPWACDCAECCRSAPQVVSYYDMYRDFDVDPDHCEREHAAYMAAQVDRAAREFSAGNITREEYIYQVSDPMDVTAAVYLNELHFFDLYGPDYYQSDIPF